MIHRRSLHSRSPIAFTEVLLHRRWLVVALVGIAAVFGTCWWWGCQNSAVREAGQTLGTPDQTASVATDYIGPQACAACHAERVAEFRFTNHFRACREPNASSMPSGFTTAHGSFASRDPGVRFEMRQVGGDFIQTAVHSTSSGEQRTNARIDLVYGGWPSDEIYFTWRGDRLYELPIAWLHSQNQWAASLFDPNGGGDFSRELSVRCLECHNTWFEHLPGTINQYKRDEVILGVTCERCHGPGREHVAYHGSHPEDRTAKFIVHPAKLPRELRMDLCAQCHSNTTKHRGPPFSYRPGLPLDNSFKTLVTRHPEDDHVANQVQYLQQSKCFQQSETLTCVTCHDPHRHKTNAPNDDATADSSCVKCHQPVDCAERDRLPVAVQNNCVGCHMPARNKIQVYFATQNDSYVSPVKTYEHRIAIYPIAQQELLLEWYRTQSDDPSRQRATQLAATLTEHWLRQAEDLRSEYRFLASIDAYRQAIRLDPAPSTRQMLQEVLSIQSNIDASWFLASRQIDEKRYPEAIETLEAMLNVKPDLAKVHGKLGMLYGATGVRDRAVEHLQLVSKYDPDDPYGEGLLGWMDYLDGRFASAVEHYRRAEEIEPFHAKIHYQMGLAFAKLERWQEACECFRQVMTIEPNHANGCQALSEALRRRGQFAESLSFALKSAEITNGKDAGALLTLAEAYAGNARFQDAEATALLARRIAESNNLQLLPQIQQRLQEFRNRTRQPAK